MVDGLSIVAGLVSADPGLKFPDVSGRASIVPWVLTPFGFTGIGIKGLTGMTDPDGRASVFDSGFTTSHCPLWRILTPAVSAKQLLP